MTQSPVRYSIRVLIPSDEFANHYRVINHYTATQTYIETIKRIGIQRVIKLHMEYGRLPLISFADHKKGRQIRSGDYYIKTPSQPYAQAYILVELAHLLDIDLIVFFEGRHITYKNLYRRKLKLSELSEEDYIHNNFLIDF